MRKRGEVIFKGGLVSSIKGTKVDDKYSIYGIVLEERSKKDFKTFIKVDLVNKRLEGVNCTCEDYKAISVDKQLFICEHLSATVHKFLHSMARKDSKREIGVESTAKNNSVKIMIEIDLKLSQRVWKGVTSYEVEIWLVYKHKYPVIDLKEFISSLKNRGEIFFNNIFTYSPIKHIISHKGIRIIDFIKKYSLNKNDSILGRSFIISPNDLREFLEVVDDGNIQFRYNDMEYKAEVIKSDLPLSFTLKEREHYFILTTHKKLPIPLNKDHSVYLFNENLYLPSKNQTDKYKLLYDKFLSKGRILYNKTIENYYALSLLLNEISKNIIFSEGLKSFVADFAKYEILIYQEESDVYCDVKVIYNNEKINILEKADNKKNSLRDLKKEEKVQMKLEYYKFIKSNGRFKFIGDDEDLFEILINKKEGIHSLGKVILGQGIRDIKIFNGDSVKLDFYEDLEWIRLDYNVGNIDKDELPHVFDSYRLGEKFYKTKDGGFINFKDDSLKRFINLIDTLKVGLNNEDGMIKVENNKAFYISGEIIGKGYKIDKGKDLIKSIDERLKDIDRKNITIPKSLKASLREYQITGFKWLKVLAELGLGGILADEMGLGKTVQTLALLLSEENKKVLIITPTSLIYNWKSEIERFAEVLKIGIAYGDKTKIKKIISEIKDYNVVLTTYGTLKNNIDEFNAVEFDFCIIDEAQNIKNPATQTAKVVKSINSKIRFALTGTPIENNLTELWSLFDFIMPGYLFSKEMFDKKFIYSKSNLEELKLLIKPFILRRTKKEVIEELPDKIEKKLLVDMTSMQKSVYNQYIKSVKEKIKDSDKEKIEVFSYLTKLRQICLDPSLLNKDYKGGSGKLKAAMELIEGQLAINGKVLLFSQFTSALKKIREVLEEKNIKYFYLDGSTSSNERINLVNEFNNSDEVKVFLISLKAGGTGLNLTSANLVIHFDPWWNPAVENQATDRAHRIGQKNIVEVIKLVARGTIEENIILLQEHKNELIQSIITGELEGNIMNKLTRDELIEILYRS